METARHRVTRWVIFIKFSLSNWINVQENKNNVSHAISGIQIEIIG